MNKNKDNIIDFVKHLEEKERAQNDSEQSLDKTEYIAKAVAELQRNAVADAQKPFIKELHKTTIENTEHDSLLNRWLFSLVNKRYPGLTIKLRNEQRAFFAKQLKAFLMLTAVIIIWVEICLPLITNHLDEPNNFLTLFSSLASVLLYLYLGAIACRVSTRQGLLDILQMHRVCQKKH